jgi:hypothetical protein
VYAQSQLALAGDDAGAAVVAWNSIERNGDPAVARAALRRVDGTWETPQNLGYADSARIETSPSVAMDARGDALVVWTKGPPVPPDFTVTSQSVVYAEFRPAGGAWGPAAVLSQSAIDGGQTRVAVNREGDALVVWSERDQTGRDLLLSSFRRAGASGWTQPLPVPVTDPLAARDDYESGVSFALDDAGDATLVTSRPSGEVEALTHAADASAWAGPVVLGRGENRSESECVRPQVAMDGRGDAVVVWRGAELYAARRAAGSAAWEQPVIVAPDPTCEGRALTADSTGDAVAIWKTPIGLVDRLESAVFDTTPPVLAKLRIPSVARIGSRVRFAVTASDLWSSVAGPPLWHFGDGTTRKGATVAHTFRRPGRYRVSVTATDEAGNTATSFGLVRMTARP